MTVLIVFVGAISGAASAALIAFINSAVHNGAPTAIILGIVVISIVKIGSGLYSQWLVLKFGQDTILRMVVDLSKKVLRAPFRKLEILGTHRVLTALTNDVQVLGAAIVQFPSLAINIAIVIGCWVYLGLLSPIGVIALTICVLAGAGIYKLLHSAAFAALFGAREERDHLMSALRSLTDGLKELQLNEARGKDFLDNEVKNTARNLRTLNLAAARKYMIMDAWSQGLFYLLIAGFLAFFPVIDAGSTEILTGYIFASLYVMTPIWSIIGALPTFVNGQASLDKLEELGVSINSEKDGGGTSARQNELVRHPEIDISGLRFSYSQSESANHEFAVGPIDFKLRPGELVFIVGGNGSGKSTFVKLLCGLYLPESGNVRLGGNIVSRENIDWYRQHFSVVFSDFYLFDRILGDASPENDRTVDEYLAKLELGHKVEVNDGKFSTTALSQGQRRRLALLTSMLEDRPVQIFDEWAADQDPQYKQVFYTDLLPKLREAGKSVVVVTHDDRYFHMGDRVIKLDEGRIEPLSSALDKTNVSFKESG